MKNSPVNVVLVRETDESGSVLSTFDYSDLNAYLLVVVGLAEPDEQDITIYDDIVSKARQHSPIPLRDIQSICRKESLVSLPGDENLLQAIEVFGSGIHRVLVVDESNEPVGVLSQMRLVEFFWAEGINFPNIERLYPAILRDLGIGSQQIISIKLVIATPRDCERC